MMVATRLSSPKSRQFIAWDVSKKGDRPVGTVVIKSGRTFFLHWAVNTSSSAAHTVPTGRVFF